MIKITRFIVGLLRRFLPAPLFKSVMRVMQQRASQLLPSGALEKIERDARATLRAPQSKGRLLQGEAQRTVYPIDHAMLIGADKAINENRSDVAIVMCCAISGEHDLLKINIGESLSADHGGEIQWVLAGSTDEDLEFIRKMAAENDRVAGFICPAEPAGKKWQTLVHFAHQRFNSQLIGIIDAGDIISSKLIDHMIVRHSRNLSHGMDDQFMPAFYCCSNRLGIQTDKNGDPNGTLAICSFGSGNAAQPPEQGRFYTASFVRPMNGLIYDSSASQRLGEQSLADAIRLELNLEYYGLDDGLYICTVVDVKNARRSGEDSGRLAAEYSFEGMALIRRELSENAQSSLKALLSGHEPCDKPISATLK